MEGKNTKKDSSSTTAEEQQSEKSPQRVEASTGIPPLARVQEPPPSSRGGPSSGGSLGGVGGMPPISMHAIPVGGDASDAAGGVGGLVMEAASRKRVREVGEGLGASESGDQLPFECTLCRKSFPTDKSLFGHLRTHRRRGWKGAFPPPVFSREEFADTGLLNPEGGEEGQGEQEMEQVAQEAAPTIDEAVGAQQAIDLNVLQPQALEGRVQYHLPDLNRSPPEEGNGNGGNGNGAGKH